MSDRLAMDPFNSLLTLPVLHDFVREAGFGGPTAVQSAAIPPLVAGKSVSVLAQTGSGKTLAYALPIVEVLKKLEALATGVEPPVRAPRAWIICPTRELGSQTEAVFKALAHRAKLRVRHLDGGAGAKRKRAAMTGSIDVLISSPSRALEALTNDQLKGDAARFVVFDEADQLFDRGFIADVKALFSRLQRQDLQVGLFSATMPGTFIDTRDQTFPGIEFDELVLQGSHRLRDNIATNNYTVPFKDKLKTALRLLGKTREPGFVFVNFKRTAQELAKQLTDALPHRSVHLLHGGMEKADRRTALKRFSDGGDLLVCTDVAARGLDLPAMKWVLNYDLPFEAVYYVHRCGRVGRTGQPAEVFNLVTTKDRALIIRINTAIANQSSLKLSRIVEKVAAKPAGGAAGSKRGKGRKTGGKTAGAGRPGKKKTRAKPAGAKRPGKKKGRARPGSRKSKSPSRKGR